MARRRSPASGDLGGKDFVAGPDGDWCEITVDDRQNTAGQENAGQNESLSLDEYDEWSRWLLVRAAPIRFAIAQTPAERTAVYRLRYQTAVARGWIQPTENPEGLEHDGYDERALHLVGWHGAELATTARLIFPSPGLLLPTEEAFGFEVAPSGRVVEWSRFIVVPAYGDREHRTVWGLMAACWLEMRARGFNFICSPLTLSVLKLFHRIGLRTTSLGPPRRYGGDERYPVLIEPPAAASPLIQLWQSETL